MTFCICGGNLGINYMERINMLGIQSYGINSSVSSRKVSSPSFRAYNLEAIKNAVKSGKMPSDSVIIEMDAELRALKNSADAESLLQRIKLTDALNAITKLKIKSYKKKFSSYIAQCADMLKTAKKTEKSEIIKIMSECKDAIKEIDKILGDL